MRGPRSKPVRIPSSLDSLIAYRLSNVKEQKPKYAPIIFGDRHPDISKVIFIPKGRKGMFSWLPYIRKTGRSRSS